ncbi:MAG: hypothetical protein LAT55_07005, partial [Opitutales bacterium]|nr:hypothetical protein [Opitutales bacterium]
MEIASQNREKDRDWHLVGGSLPPEQIGWKFTNLRGSPPTLDAFESTPGRLRRGSGDESARLRKQPSKISRLPPSPRLWRDVSATTANREVNSLRQNSQRGETLALPLRALRALVEPWLLFILS